MATNNSNKHLTLEERKIIETSITNGSTKAAIAEVLGKDKSTIGKEIKLHRVQTSVSSLALECANYKKCKFNRNCKTSCPNYIKFTCKRRDRSPGACNGCENYKSCRFNKYKYSADIANSAYKETLVDSRIGVNLTTKEAEELATIIKPLLEQGQSPYQIIEAHPELPICVKTLYNYINSDVFRVSNIIPLDLRRSVSRKPRITKEYALKKRENRKYLNGRLYKDYSNYIEENEDAKVVQMDTVYNNSGGIIIQTFKFVKYSFLFAILHKSKTNEDMLNGVNLLHTILGDELFKEEVECILTDRGSEFVCADDFELALDGSKRTRVFYCDPMSSCQKGTLENNHIELRYICPKETDLYKLGLRTQDDLNLVISHINSGAKKKLNGKSPIELMKFLSPELWTKFEEFGIHQFPSDKIVLKPYLLKK